MYAFNLKHKGPWKNYLNQSVRKWLFGKNILFNLTPFKN